MGEKMRVTHLVRRDGRSLCGRFHTLHRDYSWVRWIRLLAKPTEDQRACMGCVKGTYDTKEKLIEQSNEIWERT